MRREDKRLLIDNSLIYIHYKERLINLALSQFQWHGLPDTVDRLYFEKCLLFYGKAAMYVPEGCDFWLGTDYVHQGDLNVYGYPRQIRGVGYGSHNFIPTDPIKWQFIYDNMTMASLMPKIDLYAKLLWEVHNTYRSNLQQQITPYLVLTDKNQAFSMKNFFNRIFGFQPVVEMRNSFDPETIQTIDTRVNFIGKELLENLKIVWGEALAILGITAETTKKERMLDDELTFNRMENDIALNSRMLNRIEFCNKMNAKHGFDLSVNLSSDIEQMARFSIEEATSVDQLYDQDNPARTNYREKDAGISVKKERED